jgi:anti-sigma B factor antagonist
MASTVFTVQDVQSGQRHTLALSGELDIATAPDLEEAVEGLRENGGGAIVLDLSELTFMDSTGLQAILAAERLCEGRGYDFWVTGVNGPVRRLFDLTGAFGALRFEPRAAGATGER